MRLQWVCDSCGSPDDAKPLECPGCKNETCEHCFGKFAHCKACTEQYTDDELREVANRNGYDFEESDSE